jgi:hypothetical protein
MTVRRFKDEPEGIRAGRETFRNGYDAERHLPDGFSTDHKRENNRKDVGRQRIRWDLDGIEETMKG